MSLGEIEHRILQSALEAHGGNRTRAAAALGLTRAQFNYRLKTFREG
ncbi:MAG TPA: helix-turn-helix domain-containing protein [Sphingomonadaceae bacterium]|nr:helix-turn-helix domain-containing protein [Sphingomonadaceae bacterium]